MSFFVLMSTKTVAQSGFYFYGNKNKKQRIKFRLIHNLIVVPLQINGKKLSFILDTGVNKTILFGLSQNKNLQLHNVKRIILRGLGNGKPVEALLSQGNIFSLKNMMSYNQELFVILNDKFDLSSKMGTTIHGIIGYDLFKNVVVKIDYDSRVLTFYNPKRKKKAYKKCRKCEIFPLQFYKNKPFINAKVQLDTIGNKKTDVKLLIDSGGSDALWLFEGTKKEITTPRIFFKDVLGEGLSGTIYGNRSRIPALLLQQFNIVNPTVSFLDSISTYNARKFKKRNGSIGGNILKRFKVWIDYPHKKLMLKKSRSLKGGFYYNMSGLTVLYDGKKLIKEEIITNEKNLSSVEEGKISFVTFYRYRFKQSFKVGNVVSNSPAALAGVMKGDAIKKINGKKAYTYKLNDIIMLFQMKPNKKIRLEVERLGVLLKFEFRLKKKI